MLQCFRQQIFLVHGVTSLSVLFWFVYKGVGGLSVVQLVITFRVWKTGFGIMVWALFNCWSFFTDILYNRSYLCDDGRI